jgi:hypothetical protein
MKKNFLRLAMIGVIGQIVGFIGIFISESNNSLMLSLWTFLVFGCIGAIALILDDRYKNNLLK